MNEDAQCRFPFSWSLALCIPRGVRSFSLQVYSEAPLISVVPLLFSIWWLTLTRSIPEITLQVPHPPYFTLKWLNITLYSIQILRIPPFLYYHWQLWQAQQSIMVKHLIWSPVTTSQDFHPVDDVPFDNIPAAAHQRFGPLRLTTSHQTSFPEKPFLHGCSCIKYWYRCWQYEDTREGRCWTFGFWNAFRHHAATVIPHAQKCPVFRIEATCWLNINLLHRLYQTTPEYALQSDTLF